MEQAVRTMLGDLERSGPENVGPPVRCLAVIAADVGDLFPATVDPLARRRRRAGAARLARRAMSLATSVHGLIADRPDTARAWSYNVHEVERALQQRQDQRAADAQACVRDLARVARLVLELPPFAEEGEWQASVIAFADEAVLADLHAACLELAAAALSLAAAS